VAINEFAVDATRVRDDYFPALPPFDDESNPSSTTIARYITEASAELAGKLLLQVIDPAFITDDATPQYVWCAQTVTLMVAIRVLGVQTGQNPEAMKAWQEILAARLKDLGDNGSLALGYDDSGSDGNPKGPTTYLTELGISLPSAADASGVTPVLRRDDDL